MKMCVCVCLDIPFITCTIPAPQKDCRFGVTDYFTAGTDMILAPMIVRYAPSSFTARWVQSPLRPSSLIELAKMIPMHCNNDD